MTAYNPPDFQFSGLIFNPLIYEQGEASSSTSGSSGTFTDLTTDNLYTNNIQGKTPSSNITLYTLSSSIITLGGSLLNGIFSYATAHYWYSQAGSQLFGLRFNLYATNTISTDLYADTTAGTPATISIRASPSVLGDSTFANGIYSIFAGTTRLLNLISTSLEAPIHYLYNTAQTQKKQLVYGATTITESYFCDTTDPTIPTATLELKDAGFAGSNNGDMTLTNGRLYANSVSNIFLTAPNIGLFGNSTNIRQTSGGALARSYQYATSNLIERVNADTARPLTQTGRIDWTPSLTTPATADTGVYKLTAGDFETTAYISPMYSYVANTGTNYDGSIGRIIVGSITIANGTNLPDNGNNEFGNITNLPVGVWLIYAKIGVQTAGAMTIQRQGSYVTNTAGFVISETKYMGTSAGSTPVGLYWYENCATYSCFTTTTLRVNISIDFGGGSATASTANNRFTATRIA